MEHTQGQHSLGMNGQVFEVIADLGKVVLGKPKTEFYIRILITQSQLAEIHKILSF